MTYVDAFHSRNPDQILIVERVNGERVFTDFAPNYTLYYVDPKGTYTSIFGDKLKRFSTADGREFRNKKKTFEEKLFESDIRPVFRCLSENYRDCETPKLNIGFFDIEVGFDPSRGFAPPSDPFNGVTAISVYQQWQKKLITLVLCPPTHDAVSASAIVAEFENTILFFDEAEIIRAFFDVIEDCDVISGWNSTDYDIPYLVNRTQRIIDKETSKGFCLWDQLPREREYRKFKNSKLLTTYDLIGRVHLDYLQLYRKHNTQQLHSYTLDFVGQHEVGERKIPYEGTLDELYKNDFPKFIAYNRQDTLLLEKIDAKCKFIELSNQVAHTNTVLLSTTLGSVALVEQAIINEMHDHKVIAPDRKAEEEIMVIATEEGDAPEDDDDDDARPEHAPVVGAYVANPKVGLHDEIGAVDISSLYPSTIRALNMSPETICGQIRPIATGEHIAKVVASNATKKNDRERVEPWDALFASLEYTDVIKQSDALLTIDFEDGSSADLTGKEVYAWIFADDSNVCITANGTIFYTNREGIIPRLLARWYAERNAMKAKKDDYSKLYDEANDLDKKAEYAGQIVFWNQRQLARKILLNSLYGALLNETMRFYDQRIGQSTTLTGRSIVCHMNAKTNEVITGSYDYKGDAIIYADTDSCYFSGKELCIGLTREQIIDFYDEIAKVINATFAEFMAVNFHTGTERGGLIQAERELVASTGLFIKKKKYAVLMYDKEKKRLDKNGKPGQLKVMGLDLKRSDTPKFMQQFLEKLLMATLLRTPLDDIFEMIKTFRREFVNRPGWEKGRPMKVNVLTDSSDNSPTIEIMDLTRLKRADKANPKGVWHVRAAIAYNKLRKFNHDNYSPEIIDGSKIIVCTLRKSALGITRIAMPVDLAHIPQWFKDLPFDHEAMEESIIDKKLTNLVGVLNWNLAKTKEIDDDQLFSFG